MTKKKLSQSGNEIAAIIPVSYTHLDVYKRQSKSSKGKLPRGGTGKGESMRAHESNECHATNSQERRMETTTLAT